MKRKYLIIDDIRSANMLLSGLLSEKGDQPNAGSYSIEVARTYEEGYELLRDSVIQGEPYHYLLLDHDLGAKEESDNGYMLFKRIIELCYDVNGDIMQDAFNSLPKHMYCVSDNAPGRKNIQSLFKFVEGMRNAT